MEKDRKTNRIGLIWSFGKKYIWYFSIAEICILISYAISVLLPLNLSRLTDEVLYGSNYELLPVIIRDYIILFLTATVFNFIYAFVWQYLNNHYVLDIKNKMFEKTITAKASFLSHMNSGDIMSRIDGDSDQFIHVIQRNVFHFINSAVMCIGIIVLVAKINITIAVMLVVAAILPIILTRFSGKFTERFSKESRTISGKLIGRLYEIFKGFREIKLFKAETWAENQLLNPLIKLITLGNRIRRVDFLVNKGIYLINLTASIVIYGFSAYLIIRQELTIGLFLATIEYIALLHKKFNWMLRIYLDWYSRKVSIDRVSDILEQEPENTEGIYQDNIESVEFNNVSFSYEKDNSVLRDVSFNIKKGQTVGIVGSSGTGKSTIISLLLGMYQTQGGNILINGIPIDKISPISIRKQIGVVSQDIMLFEDSIRYNLNLGNNYPDDEIFKALENVELASVINDLPEGLDTVISPSTHNLSGGQKQRLMIARLLLKGARFIVMDEATSALDVETEHTITNYLHKNLDDITMLIISHRLEAIRNCDVIYVLNENVIEDYGTHNELLLKSQTYNALFGGDKR